MVVGGVGVEWCGCGGWGGVGGGGVDGCEGSKANLSQ